MLAAMDRVTVWCVLLWGAARHNPVGQLQCARERVKALRIECLQHEHLHVTFEYLHVYTLLAGTQYLVCACPPPDDHAHCNPL